MVKRIVILGIVSFSILWTGLVAEAHDGKESINQETEYAQKSITSEQEPIQSKNNSDTTHKKDKCCDEDKENH